ncbi:hypothetical protein ACF073_29005 [Streptomyces sp. NPDC015171]|uniref:hypothetical protein n=1 Tax=Streptomyces sp. NPDC015171 TaxID=3364945 RepID=UPI0036FB1031
MGPVQRGDVSTWVASGFAGAAAEFAYQTIRGQQQQIGEQQQFITGQSHFMTEQTRFMGVQQQNLELERAPNPRNPLTWASNSPSPFTC